MMRMRTSRPSSRALWLSVKMIDCRDQLSVTVQERETHLEATGVAGQFQDPR